MSRTAQVINRLRRGPATRRDIALALGVEDNQAVNSYISRARRFLREQEADIQICYSPETQRHSLTSAWETPEREDVYTWLVHRAPSAHTTLANMEHSISNTFAGYSGRTRVGRHVRALQASIDLARIELESLVEALEPVSA